MIHGMLFPINPMAMRPPASALNLVNVVAVDRSMKLEHSGASLIDGNEWFGGGK
jgi:hypothetical protein